jgi:hypothetical protein
VQCADSGAGNEISRNKTGAAFAVGPRDIIAA